jgi:electron transfer flavoprotein alpha subunit
MAENWADACQQQLNIGLVADCIDCSYATEDDAITWIRPAYTGKLFVKILTTSRPQLATISSKIFRGNAFDPARTGKVTMETLTLADLAASQKVVGFVPDEEVTEVSKDLAVENAAVVVGAGRGVATADGMKQVQAVAKAIGAGFGVSKPLVDEGWAPHDWQVGITGKQIAPDIYIALGISGSIQHQMGIKEAKLVIAVNTDPEAPIFKRANYGIVGDLFKALPMIQEEFKKK